MQAHENKQKATNSANKEDYKVVIDKQLQDLIPNYLKTKKDDLIKCKEAAQNGNVELIRTIGHKMKGSGGGYGFSQISELGKRLETAAKSNDLSDINSILQSLEAFLTKVKVEFQ